MINTNSSIEQNILANITAPIPDKPIISLDQPINLTANLVQKVANPIQTPPKMLKHLQELWKLNEHYTSEWLKVLPEGQPILGETYDAQFNDSDNYGCPMNGRGIKLLIIINSPPQNREHRLNIRKTYGFYKILPDVKIFFFIGDSDNPNIENKLKAEERLFNDIVRSKRKDRHFWLTYKMVSILEFVMKKCLYARYVAKVEDNVFINIPAILTFIDEHRHDERKIYGLPRVQVPVSREVTVKTFLRQEEYPAMFLPEFIDGKFFFMKVNLVPELFYTSLKTQFFKLDDVFLTGFVAPQLGIKLVYLRGIFHNREKFKEINEIDYLICYFFSDTLDKIYHLWTFMPEYNKVENVNMI